MLSSPDFKKGYKLCQPAREPPGNAGILPALCGVVNRKLADRMPALQLRDDGGSMFMVVASDHTCGWIAQRASQMLTQLQACAKQPHLGVGLS